MGGVINLSKVGFRHFVSLLVISLILVANIGTSVAKSNHESSVPAHHLEFESTYSFGEHTKCPRSCVCSGTTVDCSHRGLRGVPRGIPTNTERL